MIVFWRGWGLLVPVIGFLQLILTELAVNALTGVPDYYAQHGWPKLLGCVLGGLSIWLLAQYLRGRDGGGKVLVDKATGKEVILRRRDEFMFVPMLYWGPILGAIGVAMLFVK